MRRKIRNAKIDINKGTHIDQFHEYPIYSGNFEKSKMPNFNTTFLLLLTGNEKTEVTYKLSMRISFIMNNLNNSIIVLDNIASRLYNNNGK